MSHPGLVLVQPCKTSWNVLMSPSLENPSEGKLGQWLWLTTEIVNRPHKQIYVKNESHIWVQFHLIQVSGLCTISWNLNLVKLGSGIRTLKKPLIIQTEPLWLSMGSAILTQVMNGPVDPCWIPVDSMFTKPTHKTCPPEVTIRFFKQLYYWCSQILFHNVINHKNN